MDRLLTVDGSNLLFQMFFGMPARIVNERGRAVHGTLGFVGALLKIIRATNPTHIAVLFDGEHENSRSAVDPDYKSNRPDYGQAPPEENPFSQLPDIFAALGFLNIRYAETSDCEADDWIAGYALTCGTKAEVIISSFDSDFFQLIADKVSVLRYRGKNTVVCTPDYIKEKLCILPSQYADFKSLTGDRADNIRGADGIGSKTAALLLNEFGTLENIIANAENIRKPSVRKSVTESVERLKTNYKLIKLGGGSPLPFSMSELEYTRKEITTNEVLRGIGLR